MKAVASDVRLPQNEYDHVQRVISSLERSPTSGRPQEQDAPREVSAPTDVEAKLSNTSVQEEGKTSTQAPVSLDTALSLLEESLPQIRKDIAESNKLARSVQRFAEENKHYREKVSQLNVQTQDLQVALDVQRKDLTTVQHEKRELEATVSDLEREIKGVRNRSEQDIRRAKSDAEHAVQTFKHQLWQRVLPSFVEGMDESIDEGSLPSGQAILLGRLRDILIEFQELQIVPEARCRNLK